MTLRTGSDQLAARGELERGYEAQQRGDLVRRQARAAMLEQLLAQLLEWLARDRRMQYDLGDHQRAGDRIAACAHQRHAHPGVFVDHGLDLLGEDLQSTDVDDSAAPPAELIASVDPFHQVAGIDEAVGADYRVGVLTEITHRV